MTRVVLFLIFISGVSIWQIPVLYKRKLTNEVWGYGFIMLLVAVLGTLQILGIPHSNPIAPFRTLFEPLGKKILGQ